MHIAVIGSGSVGGTLGTRWAALGHEVVFGVRDPKSDKIRELLATSCNARAVSVSDAASESDFVVLATPWPAAREAIRSAGDLKGKVLLDCTNPLKPDLLLDVGHTTSGGELVAGWAVGARVVKIFNTTGFGNMANPHYGEQAATMFYAGDDSVLCRGRQRRQADRWPIGNGFGIRSRRCRPPQECPTSGTVGRVVD